MPYRHCKEPAPLGKAPQETDGVLHSAKAHEGHRFTNIPVGLFVGAGGAGPCILVAVISPDDPEHGRTIWAYHFEAGQNPYATLDASGPFPEGSTIVFGGGDPTASSAGTLRSALNFVGDNKTLKFLGFVDSIELYVDRDGNIFTGRVAFDMEKTEN